jgi:hypothetical protein
MYLGHDVHGSTLWTSKLFILKFGSRRPVAIVRNLEIRWSWVLTGLELCTLVKNLRTKYKILTYPKIPLSGRSNLYELSHYRRNKNNLD